MKLTEPELIAARELVISLRAGHRAIIREADEWRPLAQFVLSQVRFVCENKLSYDDYLWAWGHRGDTWSPGEKILVPREPDDREEIKRLEKFIEDNAQKVEDDKHRLLLETVAAVQKDNRRLSEELEQSRKVNLEIERFRVELRRHCEELERRVRELDAEKENWKRRRFRSIMGENR
jgi:superfamily II DNA/RNA helicase